MSRAMAIAVGLLLAILTLMGQSSGLSLRGERCGQLTCSLRDYCSPDENRCAPCSGICDQDNHNFDLTLCDSKCQDYLHDMRYVRRDDNNKLSNDNEPFLKVTVQNLQTKISILTIIVSIILLLLVSILGVIFFRYAKKNYHRLSWAWIRKKMQSPKRTPHKAPAESNEPSKAELPTVSNVDPQPLSARALQAPHPRRQPAEDSSLDYSYDNMALNLTPSPSTVNRQPQI